MRTNGAALQSSTAEEPNEGRDRIDQGREPACVEVCPTEALIFGDLDETANPDAEGGGDSGVESRPLSEIIARNNARQLLPAKGTEPRGIYIG